MVDKLAEFATRGQAAQRGVDHVLLAIAAEREAFIHTLNRLHIALLGDKANGDLGREGARKARDMIKAEIARLKR